ncbi:DNA-binding MarR family transcriptional regulator [Nocardia transvalensis]|uniref:DNA-binding MarR family transcriptional regulator n=1 Tax=Nocardia transvalensis TaxID=37333 RepID=A0A7W9PAZ4_9NOCA|nr:MarR family transcriptional regulator [Nocardia transvalensis]MBB5912680.1 DNA-binding MarR family transcriptional regulator [Nocardia transvalensis]
MADDEMNVGLLMFIAYRSMEERIYAALAEAGYGDVSVAQGRLAGRLAPQGSRITELAEQAQVTKQTAGFLVDQLERAGYVERTPDPSDGRARLVRLSPRGREMADYSNEIAHAVQDEWAAHLGARRMRNLREALTHLRDITDPYA